MKTIRTFLLSFCYVALAWGTLSAQVMRGDNIKFFAVNSRDHIFAVTYGQGIYRSLNNGVLWTHLPLDNSLSIKTVAFNKKGHIYVGHRDGIVVSQDNGDTWKTIPVSFSEISAIAVSSKNVLFAVADKQDVMCSTDNGLHWKKINTQKTYVFSLALNSRDVLFVLTSTMGVMRSADNGNTWDDVGISGVSLESLVIDPRDYLFGLTSDGKVALSGTDGDIWQQVGWKDLEGFPVPYNYDVKYFFPNASERYLAAGTTHIFFRPQLSGGWKVIDFVDKEYITAIALDSKSRMFIATRKDLFCSKDYGKQWVRLSLSE